MSSSKYGEIIDTVCDVMSTSDNNTLESITTMSALVVLDSNDQDKRTKFQELQYKCLEKSVALGEIYLSLSSSQKTRAQLPESNILLSRVGRRIL